VVSVVATWRWDGTDDLFDIRSLRGLEACVGLVELHLQLLSGTLDLAPLAGLPRLEVVELRGQVERLGPLVKLPRLRRLRVKKTGASARALKQLQGRGVTVEIG
jgi:hypothetical protein